MCKRLGSVYKCEAGLDLSIATATKDKNIFTWIAVQL